MILSWQFIKKNGYGKSEALKVAWLNIKLKAQMKGRIVKFYFQKVDGTLPMYPAFVCPSTLRLNSCFLIFSFKSAILLINLSCCTFTIYRTKYRRGFTALRWLMDEG